MKPVIHPSAVCYLAQALIKMVAAQGGCHSLQWSTVIIAIETVDYWVDDGNVSASATSFPHFCTLLQTHTHTVTCDFPHLCGKTQWRELTQMNGADLEGLVIWFLCGSLVDSGAFTLPVSAVGWERIELCEEDLNFFLDAEDGLYLLSECSLVLSKMCH